jgi:hypothetical protein
MSHASHSSRQPMPPETFAMLGEDRIAYIKPIPSERVGFLYAEAPLLAAGAIVFVLYAADGTPIDIAETFEAAAADAATYELEPVTLH